MVYNAQVSGKDIMKQPPKHSVWTVVYDLMAASFLLDAFVYKYADYNYGQCQ